MTKPQAVSIDVLKNCCSHCIDIELPSGTKVSIQPSNEVIRLVTDDTVECSAGGIPIARRVYYHSALLPPVKDGVLYIVPKQVALAYAEVRDDFVYPDTQSATEWDGETNRPKNVKQLRFPPRLLR